MSTIVPDDNTPVVRFIPMPVCEHCGGPVREQRCDPVDRTEPGDAWVTMVPGPTYNLPCGCIIRPGCEPIVGIDFSELRETLDRTPSGEHTSADTDDVVARIDSAVEDWEDGDAATWRADGSHEHDPPFWTRMDYGNGAMSGQADWGCDDAAFRMRIRETPSEPIATPWAEEREPPSTRAFYWAAGEGARRDLADRLNAAMATIDRWRRRIGR